MRKFIVMTNRIQNQKLAASKKTAIGAWFAILTLAGCTSGFGVQTERSEKTFSNEASQTGYKVLVEKPTFVDVATGISKETREASDATLAASVKNVRLDMDDMNSSIVNFKLALTQGESVQISSAVRLRTATSYSFNGTSADGRFDVAGLCAENFCEHASVVLREVSTKKYVFIEYTRTLEYLKPEDLDKIQASNKDDRELLNDVIEYHLPITRHAARIAGRDTKTAIVDLLIVARPAVDAQDDSFEEDEQAPKQPSEKQPSEKTPDKTPEKTVADSKNEEHTIELEAISEDTDVSGGDTAKSESSKPTSSRTLTLTSNPYDVYKIKIPTERLKGLAIPRDPNFLRTSFEIVPAERQHYGEPAHRIALLAEAFVESQVKVYRNACNIYVRSVMMLAGYTKGGAPVANNFAQLFQTRGQGLNEWERVGFRQNGSSTLKTVNQSGVQTVLNEIPDGYATVAQWIRSKTGHVGIVARIDNRVYLMDGNLNATKRGLKKKEITAKDLTNIGSRNNLIIYGPKGVVKNRRI